MNTVLLNSIHWSVETRFWQVQIQRKHSSNALHRVPLQRKKCENIKKIYIGKLSGNSKKMSYLDVICEFI